MIVLDGAPAFVPVEVSPSTYVDTLGRFLVERLAADPGGRLTDLLAQAIEESASLLDLRPGSSPSSTVAITREAGDALDLLVLGDSQIATPQGVYVDDRIASFAQEQRAAYRARLLAGCGYDETHCELLKTLQAEQARYRNIKDGYWIAEAAPAAARHAITLQLDLDSALWCALATDGAYRPMEHLRLNDWSAVASMSSVELAGLLSTIDCWETFEAADGQRLPRAKLHDDKAIATVQRLRTY